MKLLSILFLLLPVFAFSQINIPERGVLFDDSSVPSVYVDLPSADLDNLLAPGNEWENFLYPARFIFDNGIIRDTLEEVGLRLRGNTSRNAAKKSFKIDFNEYVDGRKYHGVEKLNLNGEHNDPSVSRSKICWDILRWMELPGSRTNQVKLYLNGEYFGLYANIEHYDEEFLDTYFGNNTGNFYKCIYPADLNYKGANADLYKEEYWGRRAYQLKTNIELDDYSHFAEMVDVLNNTPVSELECALEAVFNINNLLKYIAFDVLTGNWDGPHYNKNNFYLYDNPATGKFEYIPYDLDNTLGIDWLNKDWGNRNIYDWENHSDTDRPLYDRVLQVPVFRERYSYYLEELIEEVFNEDFLFPYLDEMRDLIAPSIQEDAYYPLDYGFTFQEFYSCFEEELDYFQTDYSVKNFIETRKNTALEQLEIINISPLISDLSHSFPPQGQPFVITAFVEEEESDFTVQFCYILEGQTEPTCLMMEDDGLNNDEGANDGVYGIVFNSPISDGFLSFFIQAVDNQMNTSRFPACSNRILSFGSSFYPLTINELMASNNNTLLDDSGTAEDWIELYNLGDTPIYLGDYYLTDNEDLPAKWQLPNLWLEPNEYQLIWADKDEEEGDNHANFKLSAGGEQVLLFKQENGGLNWVERVDFPALDVDVAYARIPNGVGDFTNNFPTPRWNNDFETSVENSKVNLDFTVFPNPSKGVFWVNVESADMDVTIKVIDVFGRNIAEKKGAIGEESVYFEGLPKGLYFVKIDNGLVKSVLVN